MQLLQINLEPFFYRNFKFLPKHLYLICLIINCKVCWDSHNWFLSSEVQKWLVCSSWTLRILFSCSLTFQRASCQFWVTPWFDFVFILWCEVRRKPTVLCKNGNVAFPFLYSKILILDQFIPWWFAEIEPPARLSKTALHLVNNVSLTAPQFILHCHAHCKNAPDIV